MESGVSRTWYIVPRACSSVSYVTKSDQCLGPSGLCERYHTSQKWLVMLVCVPARVQMPRTTVAYQYHYDTFRVRDSDETAAGCGFPRR